MTPAEFKAWFEGFGEAIGDKPTAEQWARIKEQVKKLSAGPFSAQNVPIPPSWIYGPARSPPNYYPPLAPLVSGLQIKAGPDHLIQN